MAARYTEVVQSLLTPGQKLLMQQVAERTGLTDGSFMRQAILMHIAFVQRMVAGAPEDEQRIRDFERIIEEGE
jgi:hypothetical protein